MRSAVYLSVAALLAGGRAAAQFAEPIFTKAAVPNPFATVSLKLDFVSPVAQAAGTASQALPVSAMEIGLGKGFETVIQVPLLRISQPNGTSVLAAGQFSLALRYLVAGSSTGRFAIAISGRLEVPTGDSAIVGNETQLMPAVLAEWRAVPRLVLRSNLAWNTTIAGSTGRFAFLEYANAAVWRLSGRLMPVAELVGSTNTIKGGTQMVFQPEVIVALGEHLELKTGFSIGVVPVRNYAVRSQFAWFWGRRQ